MSAILRPLCLALAGTMLAAPGAAVTHSQLLRDPKMNARRFANHFEYFKYRLVAEVQPVDVFLATETGDCDDYAILADHVLRGRDFGTVLVHVRMAGTIAHAVCYVKEDRAYLDYNNRNVFFTLTRAEDSLREIATKVAKSLEANWTTASSFTYSYETRQKKMLHTIAKTDPPELDDAPREPADSSRLLVP